MWRGTVMLLLLGAERVLLRTIKKREIVLVVTVVVRGRVEKCGRTA